VLPLIVLAVVVASWWLASPEPVQAAPKRKNATQRKSTTKAAPRRTRSKQPVKRTAKQAVRTALGDAATAYIRSAGASDLHVRVASNAGRATRVTASTTDRAVRSAWRILERTAARRWEDPERWEARWRGAVVKPYTDLPVDEPETDPNTDEEQAAEVEPEEQKDSTTEQEPEPGAADPEPIYQDTDTEVIDAEIIDEQENPVAYDLTAPSSTGLTGGGGSLDLAAAEELPSSDAEYLEIAGNIAQAIHQAAERLTVLHEGLTVDVRLDQQALTPLQQLSELLTEAAAVASTMATKFISHYEQVREFVQDGGVLPRSGDFLTGDGN